MSVPGAQQYGFLVEWHDPQADLLREYTLTFYQMDSGNHEVAMFDPKNRRAFLRRTPIPGLQLNDFHIGSTVTV